MEPQTDWYVVRTSAQAEEKAARNLQAAGYAVLRPIMRKSIRHHRTKRWHIKEFPLFNRYIFVGMDGFCDWFTVHNCDGVDAVLGVGGTPYKVPEREIAVVIADQDAGRFDSIRPSEDQLARDRLVATRRRFKPGRPIHAVSGPFGGFSGQVESVTARGTVKAVLALLGRLTPVEFDVGDIELTATG